MQNENFQTNCVNLYRTCSSITICSLVQFSPVYTLWINFTCKLLYLLTCTVALRVKARFWPLAISSYRALMQQRLVLPRRQRATWNLLVPLGTDSVHQFDERFVSLTLAHVAFRPGSDVEPIIGRCLLFAGNRAKNGTLGESRLANVRQQL